MCAKIKWLVAGLLLGVFILMCNVQPGRAMQVNDPLLRILVKKGILTEKEAMQIKKEAEIEMEKQRKMGVIQIKKEAEKAVEKQKKDIYEAVMEKVKKEGIGLPKALRGVKLGTLTYLDYSNGHGPFYNGDRRGQSYFSVTRAYFNFKKKINPWLSFRLTPDITGGNKDSYTLRIKYAYAQFNLPNWKNYLTGMKIEFGQGHFPWLDFEEHINPYRMQGTMAREFFGTFNSADRGISVAGNIGGKLEKGFLKDLSKHYPVFSHYAGKYGTFWFSYMNGSGYHNAEVNENKAVEGRITIRPFGRCTGSMFPLAGLQFSYFFIRGEGHGKVKNQLYRLPDEWPDYNVDMFMLSYQHTWFVFSVQYSTSDGNNSGKWVVDTNGDGIGDNELETNLFSFFGDVTLPLFHEKLHVFGRYDVFDPNDNNPFWDGNQWVSDENDKAEHFLAGFAYYLTGKNILMLNFEWLDYDDNYRSGASNFGNWGKYDPSGTSRLENGFRVQTVVQMSF